MFFNGFRLFHSNNWFAVLGIAALNVPNTAFSAASVQMGNNTPLQVSRHKADTSQTVYELGNPQVAVISSNDPVAQIDPNAKAEWLTECRRRASGFHVRPTPNVSASNIEEATHQNNLDKSIVREVNNSEASDYDYCATYFDTYFQKSEGYGLINNQQSKAINPKLNLIALASSDNPEDSSYEIVEITETYLPVRTRYIPRRTEKRQRYAKQIK